MRCMSVHSTLMLYAAPTGTDTTALPTLLGTDNDSRNRRAVIRCICGNRNPFDAAQIATLSTLNVPEGWEPLSGFREEFFSETRLQPRNESAMLGL